MKYMRPAEIRSQIAKAAAEVTTAAQERKAQADKIAVLYGEARYTDQPQEVWKSRTRDPRFIPPDNTQYRTLGGVSV